MTEVKQVDEIEPTSWMHAAAQHRCKVHQVSPPPISHFPYGPNTPSMLSACSFLHKTCTDPTRTCKMLWFHNWYCCHDRKKLGRHQRVTTKRNRGEQ